MQELINTEIDVEEYQKCVERISEFLIMLQAEEIQPMGTPSQFAFYVENPHPNTVH